MHPGTPGFAYYVFLLRDLFPDPFILSAERFGVSLFYRELDFTKNQIVDLLQKHASDGSTKSPSPYLIVDATTSRYATTSISRGAFPICRATCRRSSITDFSTTSRT